MLKQILTTSSLIIVAAVSIQSASADGSKSRRILVEPTGNTSILAGSKFKTLIATPNSGIVSPSDAPVVASGGGNTQIKQLIVSPQGGTPSPSSDPVVVVDNGNNNGRNNNDRPIRTNNQQIVVTPKPVFTADANAGQNFAQPVVADAAFTQDQDQDPAPAADPVVATDDTTVAQDPAPVVDQTADAASSSDDSDATAVDTAASDATPAADETDATIEHSPKHLYTLLTGRGYEVKVLKRDTYGNYLFRATNDQGGYLLLVDGYDGKVLYRKSIEAAAYSYAPAAHPYPVVSYNTENCNY